MRRLRSVDTWCVPDSAHPHGMQMCSFSMSGASTASEATRLSSMTSTRRQGGGRGTAPWPHAAATARRCRFACHALLLALLACCMQSAVSSLTAEPPLLSSAQLRSHWARMLGEQPAASSSQSASGSQQHLPPGADMLTTCINSGYQPRNMSWELALTDKMPALKVSVLAGVCAQPHTHACNWCAAACACQHPACMPRRMRMQQQVGAHARTANCQCWLLSERSNLGCWPCTAGSQGVVVSCQ